MIKSQNDLERKEERDDYIKDRTSVSIEQSKIELKEVSELIKQLNNYIDGIIDLSQNSIYLKISRLLTHFNFNLGFSCPSDIALRRARKFDDKPSKIPYCFDHLQDLSYIPCKSKDSKLLVKLKKLTWSKEPRTLTLRDWQYQYSELCKIFIIPQGRFNQKTESMYYATIHFKDTEQFFETAISEINGQVNEYINILDSIPKKRLNVVYIGIFDDFVRNKEAPKWVDEEYYLICEQFQDACKEKDNIYIYESFILCNAFLSDIVKRDSKTSDRLYDVTSMISSWLFEEPNFEAIIYESTKVKEEPSIVIKPQIVDRHIEHKQAICFKINENFGYGLYKGKNIKKVDIKNNILNWEIS